MTSDNDLTLEIRPIGLELADRLEDAIIRETFAPGEKLRELEICALYGVSRSPLREAFQILETRGLVERRPRFGTRVTDMTVALYDEITACRIPLEGTCSGLLARHGDHVRIAEALDAELTAMEAADAAGEAEAAFDANVRMTALLHQNCGNRMLTKLLAQLDKPALRYRYHAYRRAPGLVSNMVDSNRAMITAILAGNPSEAEAVTRGLVERAWQSTRELFLSNQD